MKIADCRLPIADWGWIRRIIAGILVGLTCWSAGAGNAVITITDALNNPIPNQKCVLSFFSAPQATTTGSSIQWRTAMYSDSSGTIILTNAAPGKWEVDPTDPDLVSFTFYMPPTNGTINVTAWMTSDAGNTRPPDTMSWGVNASDLRAQQIALAVAQGVVATNSGGGGGSGTITNGVATNAPGVVVIGPTIVVSTNYDALGAASAVTLNMVTNNNAAVVNLASNLVVGTPDLIDAAALTNFIVYGSAQFFSGVNFYDAFTVHLLLDALGGEDVGILGSVALRANDVNPATPNDHSGSIYLTEYTSVTNTIALEGSNGTIRASQFVGNLVNASNLPAAQLTGTLPLAALPGVVVTNSTAWLYPLKTKMAFIATRARYSDLTTAGNTVCNMRTMHIARDNISQITIGWQNFTFAEASAGTAVMAAAVEYPSNNFKALTFNGLLRATNSTGTIIQSDTNTLTIPIPLGATFWVRSYYSNSAGILYNAHASTIYDYHAFSTTTGDLTTTPGTSGYSSGSNLGSPPLFIAGFTARPAILGLSDSRNYGVGDTSNPSDLTGQQGAGRFVDSYYAFCNAGMPSEQINDYLSHHTQRDYLTNFASAVIFSMGINDITAGNGASLFLYYSNAMTRASLPVLACTIEPKTTSSDSWATLAGQTVDTANAYRTNLNEILRDGQMPGVTRVLDTAAIAESSRNSGIWAVNGAANGYTTDGLHPDESMLIQYGASLGDVLTGSASVGVGGGIVSGPLFVQGIITGNGSGLSGLPYSALSPAAQAAVTNAAAGGGSAPNVLTTNSASTQIVSGVLVLTNAANVISGVETNLSTTAGTNDLIYTDANGIFQPVPQLTWIAKTGTLSVSNAIAGGSYVLIGTNGSVKAYDSSTSKYVAFSSGALDMSSGGSFTFFNGSMSPTFGFTSAGASFGIKISGPIIAGSLLATNGIGSLATNIIPASMGWIGTTNATAYTQIWNVSGTSGSIIFYNRADAGGLSIAKTPLWTNTVSATGEDIDVGANCGLSIQSGVGVVGTGRAE